MNRDMLVVRRAQVRPDAVPQDLVSVVVATVAPVGAVLWIADRGQVRP